MPGHRDSGHGRRRCGCGRGRDGWCRRSRCPLRIGWCERSVDIGSTCNWRSQPTSYRRSEPNRALRGAPAIGIILALLLTFLCTLHLPTDPRIPQPTSPPPRLLSVPVSAPTCGRRLLAIPIPPLAIPVVCAGGSSRAPAARTGRLFALCISLRLGAHAGRNSWLELAWGKVRARDVLGVHRWWRGDAPGRGLARG